MTQEEPAVTDAPPFFTKYDYHKPSFDIISDLVDELGAINDVLVYGAEKYGRDNWKLGTSEDDRKRYASAGIRHFMAYLSGSRYDSESGHHHIAHAAANALFLLNLDNKQESTDVP